MTVPVVKQHAPSLVSTPPRGEDTPGGLAQLVMTVYIVCFNDLTQYLSIICLLKASPDVSVLMVVRSGWVMPVSAGVWVPAAVVIGGFVSIPGLGALLDRVSPICGGRSLSWLDQRDLVDLDFGIWRVLDVDVHQGWVERHWGRRDPSLYNIEEHLQQCHMVSGPDKVLGGSPNILKFAMKIN